MVRNQFNSTFMRSFHIALRGTVVDCNYYAGRDEEGSDLISGYHFNARSTGGGS